jgi:hypothetical protein
MRVSRAIWDIGKGDRSLIGAFGILDLPAPNGCRNYADSCRMRVSRAIWDIGTRDRSLIGAFGILDPFPRRMDADSCRMHVARAIFGFELEHPS